MANSHCCRKKRDDKYVNKMKFLTMIL